MMGIGFLELLVIVLVAVIVLGPAKAIDMAPQRGEDGGRGTPVIYRFVVNAGTEQVGRPA